MAQGVGLIRSWMIVDQGGVWRAMKSFVRGLVVLGILGGAGFVGIVYLAQAVEPQSAPVEKTISNDAFSR